MTSWQTSRRLESSRRLWFGCFQMDEHEKRIGRVLFEARKRDREIQEFQKSKLQGYADFEREFRLARQNVLRPVLEGLAGKLTQEGYPAKVATRDGAMPDEFGERTDAIGLFIDHPGLHRPASIELIGSRLKGQVGVAFTIVTRNGSTGDVCEWCDLNLLTSDRVSSLVADFIEKMGPYLPPPVTA